MLNLPKTDPLVLQLETYSPNRQNWVANIRKWSRWYDPGNMNSGAVPIQPARLVDALQKAAPANCMLLVDSGAHRAFTGHYWMSSSPRSYFTSTTMAPMGWAIAAAIGAKLAQPDRPCAVITGDACMLMHGLEIHTAARYQLPIVYIVINNSAHGNVWLRLKQIFGAEVANIAKLPPPHDWVSFAMALGGDGWTVDDPHSIETILRGVFSDAAEKKKPYVVNVVCELDAPTPTYPWKNAQQILFD
jgi:acetolactate synthase-1/2/3 large subunit